MSKARPRLIAVVVAILGLALSGLLALPAQAADTGVISGVVKAKPAGGSASVMAGSNVYAYLRDADGFSELAASDTTDAQGRYDLTGLAAGDYEVRILPSGESAGTYAEEYYDDSWTVYGAAQVEVGAGTTTLDDVVLEPAGWVTGRVTDDAGAPVANASIHVRSAGSNGGYGLTTDADGYYDTRDGDYTDDLIPGDYVVEASGPSSASLDDPVYARAEQPVVVGPKAGTTRDLVITRLKTVVFTVRDSAGAPVAMTPVDLRIQTEPGGAFELPQYGPIGTDDEGKFRVEEHAHAYKVGFRPADGGSEVTEWWDGATGTAKEADALAVTFPATAPLKREHTVTLGDLSAGSPRISGTARVGRTLTAVSGAWTPSSPTLSYRWLADGKPIADAHGPTFRPGTAQVGKRISVAVTGTHDGRSATATSAATAAVVGVLKSAKPRLSGIAKVGRTIRAVAGAWGPRPVRLTYMWLRNGKVVKGAKRASYKVTRKDRGKRIAVRVTGSKPGYATVRVVSRATKRIPR